MAEPHATTWLIALTGVRQHSTPHATLSAMDHSITALERAFQLAKSGDYASVPDIKKRLIQEGYSVAQITGRMLSNQLLALIRAAQGRNHA